MAGDIGQRPSLITGNQVVDRGDRRRETSNDEVEVEENRSNLGTIEQIAQVTVGVVELIGFFAEAQVDSVQLVPKDVRMAPVRS